MLQLLHSGKTGSQQESTLSVVTARCTSDDSSEMRPGGAAFAATYWRCSLLNGTSTSEEDCGCWLRSDQTLELQLQVSTVLF